MWFIGVEVEQERSAPPPKKKILDPPLFHPSKDENCRQLNASFTLHLSKVI